MNNLQISISQLQSDIHIGLLSIDVGRIDIFRVTATQNATFSAYFAIVHALPCLTNVR